MVGDVWMHFGFKKHKGSNKLDKSKTRYLMRHHPEMQSAKTLDPKGTQLEKAFVC